MNWEDCIKIGLTVVASLGGGGAIIAGFVHFCSERIADALSKKYELKMQKELEKFKSIVDNKTYISKTRFDTEFEIYRNLSSAFSEMVKSISILIPCGYHTVPANEEVRKEYEAKCYAKAQPTVVIAQDLLAANVPFISERIYDGYEELVRLCSLQLCSYEDRFNVFDLRPAKEKESFSREDYKRTGEIIEKWRQQNNLIREYHSTLEVIE